MFDKAAAGQVNAIILPVPTAITKGVLLSKTIFGNLLLGPTAEEQQDRETATVDETKMRELIEQGSRLLPTLANYSVTASYAGLRPATEQTLPHSALSRSAVDLRGGHSLHRPDGGARHRAIRGAALPRPFYAVLHADGAADGALAECRCSPTTRCAITRARTTAALFAIANW